MTYKNDSLMDCGYFMGGHPDGLIHFPVDKNETPSIIPWSELLDWAKSIDENEEELPCQDSKN